jgi:signal transduction histidine kinase/ligand-binding sensor domain-containing protein
MRLRPVVLATALFLSGGPTMAATIDHSSLLSEYRISAWSGGDGITLGTIRAMVQDDGYIWLASDAGLVRFDGFRFVATDLVGGSISLPAAATHAVYRARDGSLWVGYVNGLGVYRIARGVVQDVYLRNKTAGAVWAITEDHSGSIWIGCDEGIYRYVDHAWVEVPLPFPDRDHRVFDIHEDRSGTVWIGAASGLYERMRNGAFRRYPGIDRITRSISEDAHGGLWITDDQSGFRKVGGDRSRLFEARGMSVFHDHEDNLWIASMGQGLWRVRTAGSSNTPQIDRSTVQSGLISDELSAFVEDGDGNIWAGSREGLHLLKRRRVLALTDIGVVNAVTMSSDGNGWAATSAGLIALEGVTGHSPGRRRIVSNAPVRALHTAKDGTVWLATSAGLYRLVNDRLVPRSNGDPPLRAVNSIASDTFNTLWVCDEQRGLVHVTNERSESITIDARQDERPTLAHVDDRDRVWVALDSGRVALLDHGRLQTFGRPEGIPHSTVNVIADDRSGIIWLGGDGGLTAFRNGRFRTLTTDQGLPGSAVVSLLFDDEGDLWLNLRVGVIRITKDELRRAIDDPSYRLQSRHVYEAADGAAGFPVIGGVNGPDGSLWFVGSRGLTVLDPRVLRSSEQRESPTPRVEGILTGDGRFYLGEGAALQPRTSRIRVDYGTISPGRIDGVRFRYRLDGFDNDWVDAAGRRQAYYTNLPPGNYRFRVQAGEAAGAWASAVASWSFAIGPVFYQTRWFYTMCLLALGLAAIGVWRLRTRQLRKELAAIYGERIRLSREIHDTLLQSLVGISLQLDAAAYDVPDRQSRLRAVLVAMRKQIEDYIVEARQSIWDLRSPTLDRHDLVNAMRVAGERLTAGKVAFAVSVTGHPRPCPPKVETQALRIGQEAIMNAVRHAGAQRVQLEIGFGDRYLRLRVTDDGRGFDFDEVLAATPRKHYGLVSMKERAADAGGRFTVDSLPGQGARIVAEFPLDPAA